jgi:hypothetical protein
MGEPEGDGQEEQQRHPPKRKPAIIRVLRSFKRQRHSRKRPQTEHQRNEYMMARWTRRLGILTVALAVIAAFTAWILYETDQTSRASNRAFVYLDRIEAKWVETKTIDGKVINVTFFIGNSGNTPTKDLRLVGGCYTIGPQLPREPFSAFKWDEQRIAHLVIAPHQILAYPACKWTEREIDPMKSSPFNQRYFMGEIRYFDAVSGDHSEERITQFVQELAIHDFNSKSDLLNYETLLAGLHNCSDNECRNAKGDPGALAAPRWIVR